MDQEIISQLAAGRSDDLIRVMIGLIEDVRNDVAALAARIDEMDKPATLALRPHLNGQRAHTKK